MWNSKYDVFGTLKYVVKYKNELYDIILTKGNEIGISKIGKKLIADYILESCFSGRVDHDKLVKEMESCDDNTYDGIGGIGMLYTLKNDFIKKYLKNKFLK